MGDEVRARVDYHRRTSIMCNHGRPSAAGCASQVLGKLYGAGGQLVTEDHVRFDFTHFSAMTPEELGG